MFFILVLLDYQQASICTIDKFFLDIPFLFPKGAYTFLLFRSLTYQIHTFSILQKVISFSGDSILLEFLSFEMGLFLMLLLNNPALIIVLWVEALFSKDVQFIEEDIFSLKALLINLVEWFFLNYEKTTLYKGNISFAFSMSYFTLAECYCSTFTSISSLDSLSDIQ